MHTELQLISWWVGHPGVQEKVGSHKLSSGVTWVQLGKENLVMYHGELSDETQEV